jgi:predicted nuclease with TOPRIM domain
LIEKEELERILEVLYSHRILSQIIRTKSTNLLKKYEDVNRAYNHIKSNSNIIEPDKILKRMEEHDTLYDDALKRVSALEGELNSIEKNLEDCLITKNEILSTEGHTEMYRKGYYQGL